jgi:membrane-bound lytic murein transglycosylase A
LGPVPGIARPAAPPAAASRADWSVIYAREAGATALPIAEADWLAAWPAWLASCRALTAERNPRHGAWDAVCTESIFLAPSHGAQVRAFFARAMDCYRIVAIDGSASSAAGNRPTAAPHDTGLMTGYYEPVLDASRERAGLFTVPIYRAPPTGVSASRREMAVSGQLQGQELLWVRDPVEAFFLEVQGSGRLRLTDGSWVRVAYAASNGLEYRSIGRWLADQGELPLAQVSQQAIRTWAQTHPQRVRELLEQNPRVVFFRELPVGDPLAGPVGSLGVALTPGVSVAVDPRFIPLGAPLLIDTRAPVSDAALRRVTLAQDTGGAIRGPLRVDWFWGLGADAGDIAGHQHAQGSVRLLVPRGLAPESLL